MMKHFLKNIPIYLIALSLLGGTSPAWAEDQNVPLLSEEARFNEASKLLSVNPSYKAVFVKGLVCSSCGIGLRIHLKKVPGIDKKQLENGVAMDVDTQLVTVAVKEGESLDMERVRKAIYKAGYDPVHFFEMSGDTVQRVEF